MRTYSPPLVLACRGWKNELMISLQGDQPRQHAGEQADNVKAAAPPLVSVFLAQAQLDKAAPQES